MGIDRFGQVGAVTACATRERRVGACSDFISTRGRWLTLLSVLALAACTSSAPGGTPVDVPVVDIAPGDAPFVDAPALDTVTVDAPTDRGPSPDVTAPDITQDGPTGSCGAAGQECCPGDSCSAGLSCCGRACVDTSTSTTSCGACGRACNLPNASASCAAGACSVARCEPGFADCDATASNGCETNLSTASAHCGACGRACAAGEVCASGSCQSTCPRGQTTCSGSCVDTQTDAMHCGGCDRVCSLANATETCTAGACAIARCDSGFGDCDGSVANGCEASLQTDARNCGACGNACASGQVCAAGACRATCPTGTTACGSACVNLQTDAANCGACGRACALANATSGCAAGACTITRCNAGFGNCDGMVASGCETNTQTSAANCGACARACSPANGVGACVASACRVARCNAGFGNCDGNAANGCETNTNTSLANCGACARACSLPNATASCAAGACTLGACATGFGNCDANAANGCETNTTNSPSHCGMCGRACASGQVCAAGACVTTCPTGQTLCAGRCASLQTDVNNCGACARVCNLANANESCAAGVCGVASCAAGFANCDSNAANGCETNTATSTANCGACGRACSLVNAAASCAAGVCGIASCNAGFGNCDGNAANGCEVNLNTAPANCGACGRACNLANANESCAAGVCGVASCLAGFGNCDGSATNGCEVNLNTSPANCGACGRVCNLANANESCAAGVCGVASCLAGYGNCNGTASDGCEVNLNTSTTHCGACGRTCPAGQVCAAGVCTVSCTAPLTLCSGRCVNLQTDAANCGACARACALANATSGCAAGACTITRCNAGFGNCDGNVANGCETSLTMTPSNCGACGTVCRLANATSGCAASTCTVASCNTGFANCDSVASNGCEVNTTTSVNNCGACGRVCNLANANESCAAGVCGVASCLAGYGNCNGTAADGCEVNLNTSTAHCGTCGHACAAGQSCSGGTCASACGGLGQVCCSTTPVCTVGDRCSSPAAGVPALCCNNRNRPCANDDQCCGQMLCDPTSGACACRPYGAPCATLLDCCGVGSDPYFCQANTASPTQTVCCKPPLFPCASDAYCCGYSRCVGGTCSCVGAGGSCIGGECCLPLTCNASGRCA